MTNTYARKAAISTTPMRGYYNSNSQALVTTHTVTILEFCLSKGGLPCFAIALDRLLDPKLITEGYVNQTLVPLLPQLRTLAVKHGHALAAEPFAHGFRTIMRAWAEKVLGPRPSEAGAQGILASLRQWTCACEPCASVRRFLTAQAERAKTLDRIGAPKRKHVEQQLTAYARGAATYQAIMRSPQGLQVSLCFCFRGRGGPSSRVAQITKTDAMHQPIRWKVEHAKALGLLKTITTDEAEHPRIFGNALLLALVKGAALPAAPRTSASASVASSATQGPSASGPAAAADGTATVSGAGSTHARTHGPAPTETGSAGPRAAAAAAGPSVGASSSRPAPSAPITPAKRKHSESAKYDVIDLCSP